MLIKKIVFIIICIASFVACNIEPGKRETSDSKTVSQLDTVWKEVVPFKEKHDILDTNTVLIGTSDSMMQKYTSSLEKLDGIIHRIAGKVKHYNKQPIYWMEVENTGGPFMLFEINGIPHSYAFTKRQPDHRVDYLNPYIEKSGEQTLKIRAFSDENASFEKRWYTMSVRIGYGADKRESDAAPEYLTEIITLPEYVLDNGTQYWDTTITFQAQVPWDHSHRLENAVDLRTLPDLEERVLRKYEQIRQYFVNCDIAGKIESSEIKSSYYYGSLYKTSLNDIKQDILTSLLSFNPSFSKKQVFPIENYELALYRDSKIALLRGIFDKSAVIKLTEYDPEVYPEPYEVKWHVFLYLPEGETELQVY
jgi:hypothetical protein